MNSKIVFSWAFMSVAFIFVLSVVGGLLFGILTAGANLGEAGLMILFHSMLAFFGSFFQIIGIIFFAVFFWALISLKWSFIESGKFHMLFLGIYCIGFGNFFLLIYPENIFFAFWDGVSITLSLFLPRLFIKSLDEWIPSDKSDLVEMGINKR